MIWKLSRQVWWGNYESHHEAQVDAAAVINLSDNREWREYPDLNPLFTLPRWKPYLWLPHADPVRLTAEHFAILEAFAGAMHRFHRHPLLVHCWAGQHRSPAVALFVQLLHDGFTRARYEELRASQASMRDIGHDGYASSVHAEIERRIAA